MRKELAEHRLSLRVTNDTLKRADAVAARMAKHPNVAALGITRSAVIKLAITRGLEVLEREYK